MFRGPQMLTWSCPVRSLLLLRESHLSVFSEHTGAVWQGARYVKVNRREEGPSLTRSVDSNETDRRNLASKAISSGHRHPPRGSTSSKSKGVSGPWRCTVAEDSAQTPKAVSAYQDFLTSTTCLQPWRRPWEFCQFSLSFPNNSQCNHPLSHLCYRRHSVRPLSSSAHTAQTLNHFRSTPQVSSVFLQQIRGVHQAAPRVVDSWRDCLSLENEYRCRQSLGPNLKLYEVENGRKAASRSQGKNQGRWASVLVSLCSVEGQPAFLFTLRSSTLKGRHKGDVSFAGGKSDPTDRDVVATALREAWEELGIHVATERVWGVLKPLRDTSGMMIAPVLANLGPLEELSFKPNPAEVEEIFTLSLSHLCNPQNCGYTHFRVGDKYGYTSPVFRNGKHRVWGLTAFALDRTLKLIVPP